MPTAKSPSQRFLLLPPRGLQASASPASAHLGKLLRTVAPRNALSKALPVKGLKVLDSVHEDGIKLVEMSASAMRQLRKTAPGLRIIPEVFYRTARLPMEAISKRAAASASKAGATRTSGEHVLYLIDTSGAAVAGAHVVAFTNYAQGEGAEGKSRADGGVTLRLGPAKRIQRLYVYPSHSVWPLVRANLTLPRSQPITLASIDLSITDSLRHFADRVPGADGHGVTVGIIDTGVGPHRDIKVAGGANTVTGEKESDFHDSDQHGTHVAGIVGARGLAAGGMSGLAPQATLRAYRVFGQGSEGASNFAIAKAIDRAVSDGCDLINMSLGGGPADPATSAAIADARVAGVAVVCASGNDGLPVVSHPGADSRALAVGAFGRKGLMPSNSVSASHIGVLGKDKLNFMADFSNHGSAIDFAGPGVGVVSTVPSNLWAVMDGTSMSSPAITGAVARLLSANVALLNAARDQKRSDAILQMAFEAADALGFGAEYEGSGWPTT